MSHEKLDNLLKQWAWRHEVDEGHARRLASQIVEELNRLDEPLAPPTVSRIGRRRWHHELSYAAIAAAAVLLLAVFSASFWLGQRNTGDNDEGRFAPMAAISQPDIEASTQLFCEVEKLFGDQLRWVAENQGEVRLDVRRRPAPATTQAMPLLTRVVVVKRAYQHGSAWSTVLQTTVLARSEEVVELKPDPNMAGRLTLWGYPLPDGKIALDATIRLSTPIPADINVTNVLEPGTPKRVFSLRAADAEYRIYEIVTPLPLTRGISC